MIKQIIFWTLVIGLTLISCNQSSRTSIPVENQNDDLTAQENIGDKEAIQKLIRQVLTWANSQNDIDLLPVLADNRDSIYVGFDLNKHKQNLTKFKETDYFSAEFIDNYDQIILTLDRGLRNNEYEKWLVGDLPTFKFANDYNPWWDGQESFPVDFISIEILNLSSDTGEFYFTCANQCEGLEDFKTRFRAIQENNKWKLSYLEGFDFKESVKRDGQR